MGVTLQSSSDSDTRALITKAGANVQQHFKAAAAEVKANPPVEISSKSDYNTEFAAVEQETPPAATSTNVVFKTTIVTEVIVKQTAATAVNSKLNDKDAMKQHVSASGATITTATVVQTASPTRSPTKAGETWSPTSTNSPTTPTKSPTTSAPITKSPTKIPTSLETAADGMGTGIVVLIIVIIVVVIIGIVFAVVTMMGKKAAVSAKPAPQELERLGASESVP